MASIDQALDRHIEDTDFKIFSGPPVRAMGAGTTNTGHFNELGSWLTTDIQEYAPECLLVLTALEDVQAGRSALEEWSGNAYAVPRL